MPNGSHYKLDEFISLEWHASSCLDLRNTQRFRRVLLFSFRRKHEEMIKHCAFTNQYCDRAHDAAQKSLATISGKVPALILKTYWISKQTFHRVLLESSQPDYKKKS
jgi:hypothetical protein